MLSARHSAVLLATVSLLAAVASATPVSSLSSSLSSSSSNSASYNCTSLNALAPKDETTGQPILWARSSFDSDGVCIVYCDVQQKNHTVMGCMVFADPVVAAFKEAGVWDNETCDDTTVDAEDEAPRTGDPQTIITTCPHRWTLILGWDSDVSRTMGHMRNTLVLKDEASFAAFEAMLRKPQQLGE